VCVKIYILILLQTNYTELKTKRLACLFQINYYVSYAKLEYKIIFFVRSFTYCWNFRGKVCLEYFYAHM